MISFKRGLNTGDDLLNILHPIVREWFFSRFKEFSLPQLAGVMEIHSRNNILVSAPTGATKTLTAFLSILNELVDSAEKGILADKIYCAYISPLKALSNDIEKNLKEPLAEMEKIAGKELGIRIAVRTGDTPASEKSRMLKKPPHILITTPESLGIVLTSSRFADLLTGVEWVIVDEIHALAENKRGVHLSLSLERLQRLSSYICRIGLSATVAPIEGIARYLVGYEEGTERHCKVVDVQFLKGMDLKVLSPSDNLIEVDYESISSSLYELINQLIQDHKTTLIFTNTRSATERVVDHLKTRFPGQYIATADEDTEADISEEVEEVRKAVEEARRKAKRNLEAEKAVVKQALIGAHHGSLSREHRYRIEKALRDGKLKVCVSSTSLELGIDIGYIDLVILLSSPKSVARALQRIGRSGHRLHQTSKGRIIVLDRDDLVECGVLLKSAIEKKIDRIHIPRNCLDVLAQQVFGIAIMEKIAVKELFDIVKRSYCYRNLEWGDFISVIEYLGGYYTSLEDRHIYAKIWYDKEAGMIGRRGKMARVIYMTNIGTIPNETFVTVKVSDHVIGRIDEAFLERLKRGDVFVLGGEKYEFLYAKGMVAYVSASVYKPPTIPSWFSEMLPLSFDLALEIGRFRRLMEEKFSFNVSREEIIDFINSYLYVDAKSANSIFEYFREQYEFAEIPHDKKIIVETYKEGKTSHVVVHSLIGRRANDALSRAVAFAIARSQHRDVEIAINDNGFMLSCNKPFEVKKAMELLKADKLDTLLKIALDHSEVLKRRFRHCAARALMILRSYKGREQRVGRQQVSSAILMNAVKRISNDFPILKEARREVLEDLMDINNARQILEMIEKRDVRLKYISTRLPSPFAFNIALQGITDIMKMDDKIEFLKRMHQMVLARIALKNRSPESSERAIEAFSRTRKAREIFDYEKEWEKGEKERIAKRNARIELLKMQAANLKRVPMYVKEELGKMIDGERDDLREDVVERLEKDIDRIKNKCPKELAEFLDVALREVREQI
ncbi:hypothetical protein AUJ69_01220 [Candidatus Woesearchaeota archaeon CG1_02_47_18]|nr:MAG: hypothetical protein AUJ69_01220 [Candidatus Woesearchaeota archaeon CG1_02_47_18]